SGRWRRETHDQVWRPPGGYHDRAASVGICAGWRECDHATVDDSGKCATVFVGLLTRRAHDGERHDEQHSEGERNERGGGSPEKLDNAVAPGSSAGNTRVAVAQHDPRAQIAERLDLDRADGRGLIEGIFTRRAVAGARCAW